MPTKIITKAEALDLLDGPNVVQDRIVENYRWTILHEMIFVEHNKFWRLYYRVGATELQDERPFEFDEEITCYEVKAAMIPGYVLVPDPPKPILRRI